MNNPNKSIEQIWQSQPVEGMKMSAEAIRLRATKFERRISRRNLRETIASLFVIVFFAYFFATSPSILLRLTWGLFIAGMVWIVIALRVKGSPNSLPAAMGNSTCLEFFRSELGRQRDLLKNVFPWYLAPLIPGYLALNVAYVYSFHRLNLWAGLALLDVIFVAIFVGVWWMNQKAARCLQRSINDLDM